MGTRVTTVKAGRDNGVILPEPKPEVLEAAEAKKIVLDPATATPFEKVLIKMIETHRAKAQDYTGGDWWSQNFYDSAYMTGQTAGQSIEILLGTKAARLRVLLGGSKEPANEAVVDTLEDRAVYAAMAVALWDEGGYEKSPLAIVWKDEVPES